FLRPAPTPTAEPTPVPTDVPTVVPAILPSASPVPTPTIDQIWQGTLNALEAPWGRDWPQAIAMIDAFRAQNPGYRPSDDKLYAALVFYAQQLVRDGKPDDAAKQLLRAQALLPTRGEASVALRALTPTAGPAPAPAKPTR